MKENDGAVRSLEKAILLLKAVGQENRDVDLATLSTMTNLPKSTALRLLSTLKKHGLIQQDELTRRFNLGWFLISLGKSAERSFSLIKFCHPYLEELVQITGESASLSIMQNDHLIYIDQILSANIIKGIPVIGTNLQFHCSSSGKALLSTYDKKEQERNIRRIHFIKKTDHTITDPDFFRKQLQNAKETGYAFDDEETELGGRCVAAPIFNSEKKAVAAFSVVGPTSRISINDFPKLGKTVADMAQKASAALGYKE